MNTIISLSFLIHLLYYPILFGTTTAPLPTDSLPTKSPFPTYNPTASPTVITYSTHVDIYPISGVTTSKSVFIDMYRPAIQATPKNYEIYFTPKNGPCINPKISFAYRQLYSFGGPYISVYEDSYQENWQLRWCDGGSFTTECARNDWFICFSRYPLMTTYIKPDTQYSIRLYTTLLPLFLSSDCKYYDEVSCQVYLALTCDNTTFTYSPSTPPSTSPSTSPSSISTPPSRSPSRSPTRSPTKYSSNYIQPHNHNYINQLTMAAMMLTIVSAVILYYIVDMKKKRKNDNDVVNNVEVSREMEKEDKRCKGNIAIAASKHIKLTFSERNIVPSAPPPVPYEQVEMDEFNVVPSVPYEQVEEDEFNQIEEHEMEGH